MAEEKLDKKEEKVETQIKETEKAPVEKVEKKAEKQEKIELEREYVIPVRKRILKVPRYKRAKRAVKTIKEFLAKHMKVGGRDIRKVKIDIALNNEVWFRGIKKPLTKIKVKAKKINGIVYAELAEIPEVVKFKLEKEKKFKERLTQTGAKKPKITRTKSEESTPKEEEKEKTAIEANLKEIKSGAKPKKHEFSGAHANKTQPVRKTLKK